MNKFPLLMIPQPQFGMTPQPRFGMIHVAKTGKTDQETRLNAIQTMHNAGDNSLLFKMERLDKDHVAVLTGRDLELALSEPRLKVIA